MPALNQNLSDFLPTLAVLIALGELIIGLYVLYLNYQSRAYRTISWILFALAANTFALSELFQASNADQAFWPSAVLAITTSMIMPLLFAASIWLFKPSIANHIWIQRASIFALLAGSMPAVLTLLDIVAGTRLWFTPLGDNRYFGGIVDHVAYSSGILSLPLNILLFGVFGLITVTLLVYIVITGRSDLSHARSIAFWMLIASLCFSAPNFLPQSQFAIILFNLAASVCFLIAFVQAAFMQSPQSRQTTGSLQTRLTVVSLIIALPLLGTMGLLLTNQARAALEENAAASLASQNKNVINASEIWLAYSTRALRTLVDSDAIISMEPRLQTPSLRSLTATYPDIYLAVTVGMDGISVARSDGRASTDYSNRTWFKESAAGLPVSYNVGLDLSLARTALFISMPIRDSEDKVIGVGMFASELAQIDRLLTQNLAGDKSNILVIDNNNQLIVSSDPLSPVMVNLNTSPAIVALRDGETGAFRYTDENDVRWIANMDILSNGWGVIVQVQEVDLFAPIRNFQRLSITLLSIGGLILLLLTWATIRQSMEPVRSLTETAAAITGGDLSRTTPVYGDDELGILAASFNAMTAQLRDLITGLENRVNERTRDLERRAVQLQVTADVAREATSIHNPDQLFADVVRQISDRFGFYHSGLFLVEEGGDGSRAAGARYAVLRAASSEGGRRMLLRGHKLAVGREGIVGNVASTGQPRIALDVGQDAVYFNNPDLPMTRSEMAVPLKLADQVIGVLDVQSRNPSAFTEEDVAILQTLADQLAIAIENARLIEESRQALSELQNLYKRQIQEGWQKKLSNRSLVYRLSDGRVIRDTQNSFSAGDESDGVITGKREASVEESLREDSDRLEFEVPIELRGARLGLLRLGRSNKDRGEWTQHDLELARETIAHMAQALDNARLVEEVQQRAVQEEEINRIIARAQSTFGLDNVMRTAVKEIGHVVNASMVQIRLGKGMPDPAHPRSNGKQALQPENGEGGKA